MPYATLLPSRHPSNNKRACRAFINLIIATLLIPVLLGCDQTAIESSPESDSPDLRAASKNHALTATSIVVPPPPRQLRIEGDFEYVPRGRFKNPRHEIEPAGKWLRRLARAANWDQAVHYAANAALAIGALPNRAQRRFYPRLMRTFKGVSYLAELVDRPAGPTRTEVIDLLGDRYIDGAYTICFVHFGDDSAINAIPNQASNSFAYPPFYRQDCDVGRVWVEPTVHSHYHLAFEDTDIDCIILEDPWPYGREVDGECQPLDDYAAEPRLLHPHTGAGIIRIRAYTLFINNQRPFDVASFGNVGDEPVKFRYKNEAGDWYQWDSLGGNTQWGVSVYDAVEVLITHAGTSLDCGLDQEAGAPGGCPVNTAIYSLDDFVIGL